MSAEHAPVALAVLGPDGQIAAAGAAWARLTGWDPAALTGRHLQDLLSDGSRLFVETHCLPVLAAGRSVDEALIDVLDPSGEVIPMLLYAHPDRPEEIQVALTSAHRRRAQQEELRRMRRREQRQNELQALLAQIGEQALAGITPAKLATLAAEGLRELLAADRVTLVELAEPRALAISPAGSPAVEAEAVEEARTVHARFAEERVVIDLGEPERKATEVVALLVPLGAARRPDGVLAVRRQAGRYSTFEISAVQATARTLWSAFARFGEIESANHRATHDPLTGLANRRHLLACLEEALGAAAGGGAAPALLFIDLDGFKAINDTYGHTAGDRLLRAVGDRLRSAVRNQDVVARLGGDEFVILCPETGRREMAQQVARRIGAAMDPPFQIEGPDHRYVTASVGVTIAEVGASPEACLADADAAMYHQKSGRRAAPRHRVA